MLFHKIIDLRVYFVDFPCFSSLSPGGVFSSLWGFSSSSRVSLMFGRSTSLLVADEAFVISDVLCSFTGGEVYLVYVHGIGIPGRSGGSWILSRWDVTVSPTSKFPESYHISVELSCLIKPLFPFPASLFLSIREGSSGHHDSKLIDYSSLEGVYEDAVEIDSTVCLSQFEGGGIFVKVPIEHVHVEGIDGLASSVTVWMNPLSFSSTCDPPACSPPCPPPHMQPLDNPSRRNGMISHQIMPTDSTFPLPCHDSLGQSRDLYLWYFPFYLDMTSLLGQSPRI